MAEEVAKCTFAIDARNAMASLNTFGSKLGGVANLANVARAAIGGVFAGAALTMAKEFVNAASDAQETTQKFNVVFRNCTKEAETAYKTLVSAYNMSSHAAKTALTDTGDLLSGFGFFGKEALDLSAKINQLGADVASFTNYHGGAKGATEALTKALLGEREQAKMLGIAITEEQVQAQMAADAKAGLTYQTKAHAKAYATYAIACKQSVNAIGDTARTGDSYAFNLRRFSNVLDDLKRNIGAALIEPATRILQTFSGVIAKFNDVDQATLHLGVRIATIGAVVGGAVAAFFTIGFAIKSYIAMNIMATQTIAQNASATASSTVTNGTNSTSTATLTAATEAATVAKLAQTKATYAQIYALKMEQEIMLAQAKNIAAGGTGNITISSATQRRIAGEAAAEATANRAARVGNMRNSVAAGMARRNGVRATGAFSKINNVGELFNISTWLPGWKKGLSAIGKLFGKTGGMFGRLLSPFRMVGSLLGKFVPRLLGYVVPFAGWGTAIMTAVYGVGKAFKYMPKALEYIIQEVWPKVKNGFMTGLATVSDFLITWVSNLPSAIGKFLEEAWKGLSDTIARLMGYETETSIQYANDKRSAQIKEMQKRTEQLEQQEKNLAETREAALKTLKVGYASWAKEMSVTFGSDEDQGKAERQNKVDEAQAKYEKSLESAKNYEENKGKIEFAQNSKKEAIADRKAIGSKMLELDMKIQGESDPEKKAVLKEQFERLSKTEQYFAKRVDDYNEEITKLTAGYDPTAIAETSKALMTAKAEQKIGDTKSDREAKERTSEREFTKQTWAVTASGQSRTGILSQRLAEKEEAYQSDKELYERQEKAKGFLRSMMLDPSKKDKVIDNKKVSELAKSAMEGNAEAMDSLLKFFSGDEKTKAKGLFDDMAARLTEEDLFKREEEVNKARTELQESEKADRELAGRKSAFERAGTSQDRKRQQESNDEGWTKTKDKALALSKEDFQKETESYVAGIVAYKKAEKESRQKEIDSYDAKIENETDETKRLELKEEKRSKEQELLDFEKEQNKKISNAYKERNDIEKDRLQKQKSIHDDLVRTLDDYNLKELENGNTRLTNYQKQQMRMAIYDRQYASAVKDFQTADTAEKKMEALKRAGDAAGKIDDELRKNEEQRKKLASQTWKTETSSKAIVAGSTEAAAVQNRLYNNYQKRTEENTRKTSTHTQGILSFLRVQAAKQPNTIRVKVVP